MRLWPSASRKAASMSRVLKPRANSSTASRSSLLFECAERDVLRVFAEPPGPAEANEFLVDLATIRERYIGEPSAV
jgi:hypothetical protein